MNEVILADPSAPTVLLPRVEISGEGRHSIYTNRRGYAGIRVYHSRLVELGVRRPVPYKRDAGYTPRHAQDES